MSNPNSKDYDAVVVGSGPNGLAAAINLQMQGYSVLLIESKEVVGGGMRSAPLTLPGYMHDICSAIHPLAAGSPFMKTLPLEAHGASFIYPEIAAAHPFDNEDAAILCKDLEATAGQLGEDGPAYLKLMKPLTEDWDDLSKDILGPLRVPDHPLKMAQFGVNALTSASFLSRRFSTERARGLWAGMAAHAIQPLSNLATSAIGLVMLVSAHSKGWPLVAGGSQQLARAMASYFESLGGKIETGFHVTSLAQLPSAHAILFDVSPRQLLQIAGYKLSSLYRWQLNRYRYGMGVFKIDWALDGQVPFKAEACRRAGTVHLGNTFGEIAASEEMIWKGRHSDRPFVLLAQQSLFDPSRAPENKHTAWAYCHVPHGSTQDMTDVIEAQVERYAPGFRDLILHRSTMNSMQLQDYNANYLGGDITGGVNDLGQLFTRPALRWSPYRTSARGMYICSASTPPGAGVHGMCGYHASQQAIKDVLSKL
ncbi:MAG TPA: NAD(P)/FAD-dependent oxidoreductase [Sphingobacteriaceae bacterium]